MRGLFFLGFQNWLPIMVTHRKACQCSTARSFIRHRYISFRQSVCQAKSGGWAGTFAGCAARTPKKYTDWRVTLTSRFAMRHELLCCRQLHRNGTNRRSRLLVGIRIEQEYAAEVQHVSDIAHLYERNRSVESALDGLDLHEVPGDCDQVERCAMVSPSTMISECRTEPSGARQNDRACARSRAW